MANQSQGKKKSIAIVVTAKVTAETFVEGFGRYAAEAGNDVHIIADGIEPRKIRLGGGSVNFVPSAMSRNPNPVQDLISLFKLYIVLRRIKPQIVTYATPKASLLTSIVSRFLHIETRVYQVWGLRLETLKGPKRIVLYLLELLTSYLSTKILANSKSLASKYCEMRLNAGKSVTVLGKGSSHGVNTLYFSRSTFGDGPHPEPSIQTNRESLITIGFVGRLHPDKGIHTLLDALKRLKEAGYVVSAIFVGNDEGANLEIDNTIREQIHLTGHLTDTRPIYRQIDLLVLPSLREGFPNVVLEAASMSVPSIVSDGTGIVDSVIDDETGIICPVEDSKAFSDAILRLALAPEERLEMGSKARDRAVKYFQQEQVWSNLLTFLTDK